MTTTAAALAHAVPGKTVVLTGAMIPYAFALLTIMSRAMVAFARAPEMLRAGGAPTRSTSFVETPRVIAP